MTWERHDVLAVVVTIALFPHSSAVVILDHDIFCHLWLDINVLWLDYESHLAFLNPTDTDRYDIFYVVAFTIFLRDMSMLSDLWFDLNVHWLDYESHLAYLDSTDIDHYDPTYVGAYSHFLRTCRHVADAVND